MVYYNETRGHLSLQASLGFEPELEQPGSLRRRNRLGKHAACERTGRVIDACPLDPGRVDQTRRSGVTMPVTVLIEQPGAAAWVERGIDVIVGMILGTGAHSGDGKSAHPRDQWFDDHDGHAFPFHPA